MCGHEIRKRPGAGLGNITTKIICLFCENFRDSILYEKHQSIRINKDSSVGLWKVSLVELFLVPCRTSQYFNIQYYAANTLFIFFFFNKSRIADKPRSLDSETIALSFAITSKIRFLTLRHDCSVLVSWFFFGVISFYHCDSSLAAKLVKAFIFARARRRLPFLSWRAHNSNCAAISDTWKLTADNEPPASSLPRSCFRVILSTPRANVSTRNWKTPALFHGRGNTSGHEFVRTMAYEPPVPRSPVSPGRIPNWNSLEIIRGLRCIKRFHNSPRVISEAAWSSPRLCRETWATCNSSGFHGGLCDILKSRIVQVRPTRNKNERVAAFGDITRCRFYPRGRVHYLRWRAWLDWLKRSKNCWSFKLL